MPESVVEEPSSIQEERRSLAPGTDGPRPSAGRPRSLLRELVGVVSAPGILSFAGGLPATELFPTAEYSKALQSVLASDARSLQYCPPFAPLTEHIRAIMQRRGVSCDTSQIVITSGAQQGIQILAQLLLAENPSVLLEETTYSGLDSAIAAFRPRIHTVSTSLDEGIDPSEVAAQLDAGITPAFLYVVPDAHNPCGTSLSDARRDALAELARERRLPIVEDDPYGFLSYDGDPRAPLRAREESWVFYLGSFSKILAPGLRLGWMVLPEPVVAEAMIVKDALDLETPSLTQRAVARFLDNNDLFDRIEKLRDFYRSRRDAMLLALDRHLPSSVRWSRPRGGFFVWLELPEGTDTKRLLERSIREENIAFVPGAAFAVGGARADRFLRLSFSSTSIAQIDDGIGRLARLLTPGHVVGSVRKRD